MLFIFLLSNKSEKTKKDNAAEEAQMAVQQVASDRA